MLYLSQMASRPAETLGFGALFFLENSNLWVIVLSRNVSTTPSVIECFFGLTMLTRIDPRLHDSRGVEAQFDKALREQAFNCKARLHQDTMLPLDHGGSQW